MKLLLLGFFLPSLLLHLFTAQAAEPAAAIALTLTMVAEECIEPPSEESKCKEWAIRSFTDDGSEQDPSLKVNLTSRQETTLEVTPGVPAEQKVDDWDGDFFWRVEPEFPEDGQILLYLEYRYSKEGPLSASSTSGTTSSLIPLNGEKQKVGLVISSERFEAESTTTSKVIFLSATPAT